MAIRRGFLNAWACGRQSADRPAPPSPWPGLNYCNRLPRRRTRPGRRLSSALARQMLRPASGRSANAAMPAIRGNVNSPRFVEAHRLGPFTERAADVDVVKDLMIHDIDILQQLLGEEPDRVEAIGRNRL